MKICVSVRGDHLDCPVEPRFGRADRFLVVDSETMEFTVYDNSATDLSQGAGITAARNVMDTGAEIVLTGNCGPKAFRTLQAAKIALYTGLSGTVRQAVEDFKAGRLSVNSQANVESHFGSI